MLMHISSLLSLALETSSLLQIGMTVAQEVSLEEFKKLHPKCRDHKRLERSPRGKKKSKRHVLVFLNDLNISSTFNVKDLNINHVHHMDENYEQQALKTVTILN